MSSWSRLPVQSFSSNRICKLWMCGTEMVDRLVPMEHITIEINIRKFILGYLCLEDHTHRFALLKILMHTEDENVLLGMLGTYVHYGTKAKTPYQNSPILRPWPLSLRDCSMGSKYVVYAPWGLNTPPCRYCNYRTFLCTFLYWAIDSGKLGNSNNLSLRFSLKRILSIERMFFVWNGIYSIW